ncbi:MAG: DUF3021 family protein [Firmicutes bacterium]|nr:DUF3021 family protein [Bacillota bacterium]
MNKYYKIFKTVFLIVSLAFIILSYIILQRLNLTLPYIKLAIGVLLISLFISLAIVVFKSERGKSWLNALFGFIIILPTLFIMRNIFNYIIFRYTFIIYLFLITIAIIYGIAVIVVSKKAKLEAHELNSMLEKKNVNQE